MIEAHELTKRYGDTTAVHSLSFTIAPGTVTGFLGPNGAGKSTTMRMIMGLDRPTSGTVTVNGKPYRQHRAPLREVGALLEASAVHPDRSARLCDAVGGCGKRRRETLRRQMRPVSWAHMATSTRFRAPSFRMRLARWALTVLGVM